MQILHDGNLHWVCVSYIGCQKGEINYYDSMHQGRINPHVQKQIASMLDCENSNHLKVTVRAVQQQNNCVDCGVFAIAFATSLMYGNNPSSVNLKQTLMRGHLASCLTSNVMSQFPKDNKVLSQCRQHAVII